MVLALQRATHHTLHALSAALSDLNLSAAEINALANLGEGGTFSVRQLSERACTRASTLTGLLDRLENRGYLVREVDPADRRSFRLARRRVRRAGRRSARARGRGPRGGECPRD